MAENEEEFAARAPEYGPMAAWGANIDDDLYFPIVLPEPSGEFEKTPEKIRDAFKAGQIVRLIGGEKYPTAAQTTAAASAFCLLAKTEKLYDACCWVEANSIDSMRVSIETFGKLYASKSDTHSEKWQNLGQRKGRLDILTWFGDTTKTPNDNAVEPFNWIIVVNGLQALSVAYDAYRGIVRYLDYMHALRVGGNVDGSGSRPVREVRHNILLVCKNREIANVFNQYPSFSAYRLADLDLSTGETEIAEARSERDM